MTPEQKDLFPWRPEPEPEDTAKPTTEQPSREMWPHHRPRRSKSTIEQGDILDDPKMVKETVEAVLAAEGTAKQWPSEQIVVLVQNIQATGIRFLNHLEASQKSQGKRFDIKSESAPGTDFDKYFFEPRMRLMDLLAERSAERS